jgi:hypothetical protein
MPVALVGYVAHVLSTKGQFKWPQGSQSPCGITALPDLASVKLGFHFNADKHRFRRKYMDSAVAEGKISRLVKDQSIELWSNSV